MNSKPEPRRVSQIWNARKALVRRYRQGMSFYRAVQMLSSLGIIAVLWRMFVGLGTGWIVLAALSTFGLVVGYTPELKAKMTQRRLKKLGIPDECRRIGREIRTMIESSRVVGQHAGEMQDEDGNFSYPKYFEDAKAKSHRQNQLVGMIRNQHEQDVVKVARALADEKVISEEEIRSAFWELETLGPLGRLPQTLADWAVRAETHKARRR